MQKQMEVAKLKSGLLDYWVAKAKGYRPQIEEGAVWLYPEASTMPPSYEPPTACSGRRVICQQFAPSTEWVDGGPIIEEARIALSPCADAEFGKWSAELGATESDYVERRGDTALEAAMRAFVASKFGVMVDCIGDPSDTVAD